MRFLLDHDLPVYGQPEFVDYTDHSSAVAVRNALAQLQTDAEAPLPV